VVALVRDDLLDHRDGILGDRGHRFELLGGLRQRLLNRRGVALISSLGADDRARLEVDRLLGLMGQMGPTILHFRNLGVGIVRVGPVVIRAFFFRLRSTRGRGGIRVRF